MPQGNDSGAEDVLEDLPVIAEGQEDKTDYKALAIKNHGMAKRFQTMFEKSKSGAAPKPGENGSETTPKPGELDRIDMTVLRMEKITSTEEIDLVKSIMKETGKTVDQVLGSKYFQAELKEMRDFAATQAAAPAAGASRNGQAAARDSVEFWIAKGELPPADQVELRRKVVKAKREKMQNQNQFSTNPIV